MMDEYETVIKENVLFDKVPKKLMDGFIDSDTKHYMNTLDSFRDPKTDEFPGYDNIEKHPEWKSAREEVISLNNLVFLLNEAARTERFLSKPKHP